LQEQKIGEECNILGADFENWDQANMGEGQEQSRIFKRSWSPGIDSKEWIPPAYVAWRASTITLFLLGY
jgi:hypothetical protein